MSRPRMQLPHRVPALSFLGAMLAMAPLGAAWADVVIRVKPDEGAAGLMAALQKAREQRAVSQGREPIRIVLAQGRYVLNEPLVIGSADSGTARAPLVIEAEKPGTAVLTGGPQLALSGKASSQRWTFAIPKNYGGPTEQTVGQFYVNGRRAVLAREPDQGNWWFVQAPSADTLPMSQANAQRARELLKGHEGRALVQVMQSWTSGMHRVSGFTPNADGVRLQPPPKWPLMKFGTAQRYFIANVPGALNAPGEWLPSGGQIQYIPSAADAGGKAEDAVAVWPRLGTLLKIEGHGEDDDSRVQHVTLKGLAFAYTAAPIPAGGWVDQQAALDRPAAVEINNASHVQLSACKFSLLGGHGAWLRRSVRDSGISNCVFDDIGAGAIKIGDDRRAGGAPPTGKITVQGNAIFHTGRDFPGAVAIWIGKSGDNVIANNVIGHTSYTGISLGWTWGFEPQGADNNQIKDNVLFDIGQAQLSDLGAIYTLGASKGTRITGNYIRQVRDYPHYGAGAWGIYNDEGTSGMTVENNVVVGTRSGGYHLHYGRDIDINRNIFVGGELAEITWSNPGRSGAWRLKQAATSRRSANEALMINSTQTKQARAQMGLSDDPNELAFADIQAGSDITDVRAAGQLAPQYQDLLKSVLRTAQSNISHAKGLPIDAAALRVPASPSIPTPPLIARRWDFADMRPGRPPAGLAFEPDGAGANAIRLERKGTPDGAEQTCLLLEDGAASLKKYEPYVFAKPGFPTGGASARFRILLDAHSRIIHEWRDRNGVNYKSILKFTLSAEQGLEVGGKVLAPLQAGEWLDVTVAMPAGANPGSWNLKLTAGQGKPREWSNLPLVTKQVPVWGWVGWISDGVATARTCLGMLAIQPSGR